MQKTKVVCMIKITQKTNNNYMKNHISNFIKKIKIHFADKKAVRFLKRLRRQSRLLAK